MADPSYFPLTNALLCQLERVMLHPYHGAADRPGIYTIGIGSLHMPDGSLVKANSRSITLAEAQDLLDDYLRKEDATLSENLNVPLTDYQRAALLSFGYNEGIGSSRSNSGLLGSHLFALVNQNQMAAASLEFPKWVMAAGKVCPGLINRRKIEQSVFNGDLSVVVGYTPPMVDAIMPTIVPPPTQTGNSWWSHLFG